MGRENFYGDLTLCKLSGKKIQHHFSGHPQDLVEITFEGMTAEKWSSLFGWVLGQGARVMNHLGYLDLTDLSFEKFMKGEDGYIVSVTTTGGIPIHLAFVELDRVGINLAIEDIPNETVFLDLLAFTDFLADMMACPRYSIFPEFKPHEAFVINGQLVHQ